MTRKRSNYIAVLTLLALGAAPLNHLTMAQSQSEHNPPLKQRNSLNQIGLALPQLQYGTPAPNNPLIVVSLSYPDDIYVGTDKVAGEQVANRVYALLKKRPASEQVIYFQADITVKHGSVLPVLRSLREAGFERIGLGAVSRRVLRPLVLYVAVSKRGVTPAGIIKPNVTLIDVKPSGGGPDQTIEINGEAVELTSVRLKRMLRGRLATPIIVMAPKDKLFADVLWVIATLKGHGAQKVEIQVDDVG